MLIKMLVDKRGTVNNGYGNMTTTFRAGQIVDACIEEAQLWIANNEAEPVENIQGSMIDEGAQTTAPSASSAKTSKNAQKQLAEIINAKPNKKEKKK